MPSLLDMIIAARKQPQDGVPIASILGGGVAPYGIRHSGEGAKGRGFFGGLQGQGGVSTELSSEFDHGGKTIEHPLLVPTLDKDELSLLLSGAEPTEQIYSKAQQHALMRLSKGLSPFAGPQDLRVPVPK